MDYLSRTFDFDPNALNPAFAYWQRANGFWAYLPPPGYSPGVAQYWVGFLRGASIALDHQVNMDLMAADAIDLCLELAKAPDAWGMIKAAWELTIKPFHDLGPTPRSAFQRGLQAGMIVVAVVMLILGVVSFGKTAVGAIGALMRLPGMAAKLAQKGLAAARSMGGGRGGRGVTAGASATDPPTGTQSSGVTAAASTSPSAGPGGVQPGGGTGAAAALPETAPVEVPAVDGAAGAASRRPAAASGGADPVEQSLGQVKEDLASGAQAEVPPLASPLPRSYINPRFTISMSDAPAGSATTAAGLARNGPWFWKQLLIQHPELFSSANRVRIGNRISPIVDDLWVAQNPMHRSFIGDRLIHHHIEQGPIATPLPQRVHRAWHGILHPER